LSPIEKEGKASIGNVFVFFGYAEIGECVGAVSACGSSAEQGVVDD